MSRQLVYDRALLPAALGRGTAGSLRSPAASMLGGATQRRGISLSRTGYQDDEQGTTHRYARSVLGRRRDGSARLHRVSDVAQCVWRGSLGARRNLRPRLFGSGQDKWEAGRFLARRGEGQAPQSPESRGGIAMGGRCSAKWLAGDRASRPGYEVSPFRATDSPCNRETRKPGASTGGTWGWKNIGLPCKPIWRLSHVHLILDSDFSGVPDGASQRVE